MRKLIVIYINKAILTYEKAKIIFVFKEDKKIKSFAPTLLIDLIISYLVGYIMKNPLIAVAFLVAILIPSYLYSEKIDKWISVIFEKAKSHRFKILILCVIILLIIMFYPSLSSLYFNFNPPTPPENQLIVAITPFYWVKGNSEESYDKNIRYDFKEKLDDLGIKTILLDDNINNIEDAKFQGQKVGAHLIIYGETKETSVGTGNIEYNILPLPIIANLVLELSSFNYIEKGNLKLTDKLLFSTDEPITFTEPLVSNASSSIAIIAAFDKYIKSNYTSAIYFFKSANNYEAESSILFYIASSYLFNNNLNESLPNFDKAIELNPQFVEAWNNKGAALWSLGRFEEALEAFDEAIEIDSQVVEAWNNKGAALGSLGRFEEACEAYDEAIEINPQFVEAWYNKGVALENLGRFEEARKAFDEAIEINPQSENAWYNKGVVLENLGQFEEARKAFDEAIEINPQFVDAWNNKGAVLWSLGRFEEALEACNKAIEINPQHGDAWYNKGAALWSLGRFEEAREADDKADEFNSEVKN